MEIKIQRRTIQISNQPARRFGKTSPTFELPTVNKFKNIPLIYYDQPYYLIKKVNEQ
jgi:hypothetical protein